MVVPPRRYAPLAVTIAVACARSPAESPPTIPSSAPAPSATPPVAQLASWPLDGIDDATTIAFGAETGCVSRRSGTVSCWSLSAVDGGAVTPAAGKELDGVHDAVAVIGAHLALDTFCVLRRDGSVACRGIGSIQPGFDPRVSYSGLTTIPGLSDVAQVDHQLQGCATSRGGQVTCWWYDASGQVGGAPPSLLVVPIPSLRAAVEVAMITEGVVCAVLRTKAVVCRQLGSSPQETDVPELAGTLHMSSGGCSALETGHVACLSDGFPWPRDVTEIAGIADAVETTGTREEGCAVRRGGQVACWRRAGASRAFDVMDVRDVDDALHVAGTATLGCAARRSGHVACWRSA